MLVQLWFRKITPKHSICIFLLITIQIIATASPFSVDLTEEKQCECSTDQTPTLVTEFPKSDCDDVCLTPGCIHEASRAIRRMDTTANPCEDFYSFACGRFVKETIIPDEKKEVNIFSIIQDRLNGQLRTLINEKIDPNDPAPFNMAKKLYQTCTNETLTEEHGLEPLFAIINPLGGWPVVKGDEWNADSQWNWTWTVKEFRRIGFSVDYMFGFTVDGDLKNSSARTIYIGQDELGLDREYLLKGLDDDAVKAYYEYMVDVAVICGANRTRAKEELKEMVEFEIKMANISLSKEEMRDFSAMYNPLTIKETQEKYPYIEWKEYLNALLPSPLEVDENEIVVNLTPSFFEKLGKLLDETPTRVIANYLMWRVTRFSISFLNNDLRNRENAYDKIVSGQQEREAKWKECVALTRDKLPIAVGAMYVRKYFPEESKAAALDMVNGIRNEIGNILHEIDWMDENTRQSALNKYRAISAHIGYSDELMDNSRIEKFYENLQFNENNYLSVVLSISKFDKDFKFSKLRNPVESNDWQTRQPPFSVNAFYAFNENGIQFPAAILQGHFFSADRPKYMNYAAIGSVIGHEITHGFDNIGRQFDELGNLQDWWHPETRKNYLERAKCIIEQYGNYTEPFTGLQLNGVISEGENIADNGGIKESYFAYQKWQMKNGPEPKLPGLNYTPQQMFWISAAQTWCSISRPETMKKQIIEDSHTPSRFRVIGPFSNRKEFANDFQCPEGTNMNPVKKCEVW